MAANLKFREIADGLRFPEGPVWMPDGSVVVVEIEGQCLTRVGRDGRKHMIARLGGGPNGAALGPGGKIYVTNNGGFDWLDDAAHGRRPVGQAPDYSGGRIERVDPDSGRVEIVYTECNGHELRGPNDIVFDAHGGFYFTDLGKTRERDMDRGRVYYAKADGSFITEVSGPTFYANGCALSPDGKTLYFAETEVARLWAMEIAEPGVTRRMPWPSPHGGRLIYGAGGPYQRYDSMAVDSAGNICVATLIHGGITIISPDGRSANHLPLPDLYTTNICFGGADMKTAFATLSLSGRLVAIEWDHPGLKLNCY